MAMSNDSLPDHQMATQLPIPLVDNIHCSNFHPNIQGPFNDPLDHFLPSTRIPSHEWNNRRPVSDKAENLMNSIPPIFETELIGDNNKRQGGKKRKRKKDREVEKPREVVHVRAKRGQATDSHSLAERLRREKINEKLRSLQDLVPGCYKSAASLFYDFNSSEMDALETTQGTNRHETQSRERMAGEWYGSGYPQFQGTNIVP